MGDHPPITPTVDVPKGLTGEEERIYDYVAQHFLASISHENKFIEQQVTVKCGGYKFEGKGKCDMDQGWVEVMHWLKDDAIPLPKGLMRGQTYQLLKLDQTQGMTSAPGFLTESELIALMEKHGIGTDASMATHINNICEREYVTVSGTGRQLVPTKIGLALIHGYEKIDKELVDSNLRRSIEKQVD